MIFGNFTFALPLALIVFAIICLLFAIGFGFRSYYIKKMVQKADGIHNYFVSLDSVKTEDGHSIINLKKMQDQYRTLTSIGATFFVLLLIASALLAARPAVVTTSTKEKSSRDIVLCLDVSGSTLSQDREILKQYAELIKGFTTQRFAFSIFNSTSRNVFPLTDDYSLALDKINEAIEVLKPIRAESSINDLSTNENNLLLDFLAGSSSRTESASLVGDGLVSCAMQFDSLKENRSRSIVLATDNVESGKAIFTLNQALQYTNSNNIKTYAIYTGKLQDVDNKFETQYKNSVQAYSGDYFTATDSNAIGNIVAKIMRTQAAFDNNSDDVILYDLPKYILIAASLFLLLYLLAVWRLKQ